MRYLSKLYDSKYLRGKAKEGYIRPTLRQFLTADPPYEEISKYNTVTFNTDSNVSTNPESVSGVVDGESASTTLTFSNDYELDSVSHGSVSGNTWTISNVTDDISATVTAKAGCDVGVDYECSPNFTRSTQFTGAVGEDVIKVNNSMGVAPSDQSSGINWGCYGTDITGADSDTDGAQNTADIINGCSEQMKAASVCADYGDGNWYLPAVNQLQTLYSNRYSINSVADSDFVEMRYWSSTEAHLIGAYYVWFDGGATNSYSKDYIDNVRCVRSF